VDWLAIFREIGLPLTVLVACIYGLARTIIVLLSGTHAVPRWAYDKLDALYQESKLESRRLTELNEKQLAVYREHLGLGPKDGRRAGVES
jgi:hypothetical protein